MKNQLRLSAVLFLSVMFLFIPALSHAQASCRTMRSPDSQIEVSECVLASQRQVRVSARENGIIRTQIEADFALSSQVWRKIRVTQGDGRFTVDDQRRLREFNSPSLEVSAILSILANFLEPNVAVENFDANELEYRKRLKRDFFSTTESNAFGSWTPICSLMGTMLVATYGGLEEGEGAPHQSIWPVGDYKTKCKGRCGWGCQQVVPQHRSNQYTQECFNHDVCHAETGKQLGPCADAFWAAAASYAFAPDCPALRR